MSVKGGAAEESRQVTLAIKSEALPAEVLQDLTRDFGAAVNRETEVTAAAPEHPAEKGMRGDPITAGVLLLTFLSSGAAVGLFQVLKAMFERNSSLEMDFKREDGQVLTIRAENVRSAQIDRTIAVAREFFGEWG